jgi:hypothetical protein
VLLAASAFAAVELRSLRRIWGESILSCAEPLDVDGEWPIASLETAGLQATLMRSLDAALDRSPKMNVDAVVVIRGGKLVYETYHAGGPCLICRHASARRLLGEPRKYAKYQRCDRRN